MSKRIKLATLEKKNSHYIGKFSYTGEEDNGHSDVPGGYPGELGDIVVKVNPVFSTNVPKERFEEEKQKGPFLYHVMSMTLPEGIKTEIPHKLGSEMHIPNKYLGKIEKSLREKGWEVRVK